MFAAFRWRRLDGIALALLAGLLGYSALYLVVYTDNFYGGGQSLGTATSCRYAPLLLGVLASLRPSGRVALTVAVICSVISLTFLWPHHADPESAYLHIDRTTAIQRVLLFEHNQRHQQYFRCAQGYGWAPPCFNVGALIAEGLELRALFDIVHPAHVHFYRNLHPRLTAAGHECRVLARIAR